MPKPLLAAAVGVGVLAMSMLVPLPAHAESLPGTDSLFSISCAVGDQSTSALFRIDGDSAATQQIGAPADDCATGGAVDPRTGVGYYISRPATAGPESEGSLVRIDTVTGERSVVGPFPAADAMPVSLAIGLDGAAYAISYYSELYSVDLATGVVVSLGNLGHGQELDGFAVDPTNGHFYAMATLSGEAFEVDVSAATTTLIGRVLPSGDRYSGIVALQIDSGGRWWLDAVSDGASPGQSRLFSTPRPSGDVVPELEGVLDGFAQALLLAFPLPAPAPQPPAAIATTGQDSIYAISCELERTGAFAHLYALDSGTGAADQVGSGSTGILRDCATGAAVDPITGHAYYVSKLSPSATTQVPVLARIDLQTGDVSVVAPMTSAADPNVNPIAMAIGRDGAAFAISTSDQLYSVDLHSGVMTLIGHLDVAAHITAFAADPGTGVFYGVTINSRVAFQIDVATAGTTRLGSIAGPTLACALQIDSSGRWWLNGTGPAGTPLLFSMDRPERTAVLATFVGAIDVPGGHRELVSRSLLIAPAQHHSGDGDRLPPTGPTRLALSLAVAVALLVFGSIAWRVRRHMW